jgi:hypothetical protein
MSKQGLPRASTITIIYPESDSTINKQFTARGSFVNGTGTPSPGVYCTLTLGTTVLQEGWAFVNLENSTWTMGFSVTQTGTGAVLEADLYPGDPPAARPAEDPAASTSVTGLTITG